MNKVSIALILILSCSVFLYSIDKEKTLSIEEINTNITYLDDKIKDNIWVNKYKNYIAFKNIKNELFTIDKNIKKLSRRKKTKKVKNELEDLKRLKTTKQAEIVLLKEHKKSIFGKLGNSPDIGEHPKVTNPIVAISAVSYIKQLSQHKSNLNDIYNSLQYAIDILNKKIDTIEQSYSLELNQTQKLAYKTQLNDLTMEFSNFNIAKEHLETTSSVFDIKIKEITISLTDGIKNQSFKLLYIVAFIFFLVVIGFVVKFLFKRYAHKNKKIVEKSYIINKIINVSIIVISVFTFFFSYLADVTYFITVLGFASAGIAIAMKDWFMSVLGWFAMVLGNSIHVGDRIKVTKLGQEIIGDVLDISLLKITIHEDVTLSTYDTIRRAGRIVFIPNHYVFTQVIFNYSHAGLKTVWDGIDFLITFDSNHEKAKLIATEIATQYSKGYTDITRKQLNKLRRNYDLRNTNVEPRIFTFVDVNGIKISTWYQTNSFATLALRSTISTEIIDRFLQEPDIQIAYNTQTLKLHKTHTSLPTTIMGAEVE